ncbi:hypothetical protein [Natronomonas marina]|jgi:hypothetical protein|uniref:hypothetical protein n=1 Tax=Natronomonas marina TaxID=2961939 RepID=UPI0020C982B6|nr:hypothetical protein [Natronomonas marina]
MSEDPLDDGVITPERLGQLALVGNVPIFAYLGRLLFEDVLFGGVVGLLVGVGTLLHLPYFLYRSTPTAADVDGAYARRGAAGMALDAGGVVAFGSRFVVESAALALAVGGLVALVVFVPLQYALPPVGAGTAA